MRRILLPLLLAFLLVVACDKTPANGPLDGMWQLLSIETPDSVRDAKATRTYLSIQLQLAQWNYLPSNTQFFSHFEHRGDSIRFFDFAHTSPHTVQGNNDRWITEEDMASGLMNSWGIHTLDARFRVQALTSSTLVLQQADTLLRFRKF